MLNETANFVEYTQEEENSYRSLAETLQFKNLRPRHKESLRDLKWQEFKYNLKVKNYMMRQGFKSGATGGALLGFVMGIPLLYKYK